MWELRPLADNRSSENATYVPFEKADAIAVALADGLVQYALCVARTDQLLAIDIVKKVNPHILKMLAKLNVAGSDYDRVVQLMDNVVSIVACADYTPVSGLPRSVH